MLMKISPALFSSSRVSWVRGFLKKSTPSTDRENSDALEILADAPYDCEPIEVARYFESLTRVSPEIESFPYNAEWPGDRENPVIIAFFAMATSSTENTADQTPWCAAFMNWCMMRAGYAGTYSTSSGTFRCLGSETDAPRTGNVAVFNRMDSHENCSGFGHVAFFLEDLRLTVKVLGGNQSNRIKESIYWKLANCASVNDDNCQNFSLHSVRELQRP